MIAVFSRDWRPAWSSWLCAWLGWNTRSLARISLDGPSASQPRAAQPPAPGTQESNQQEAPLSGERQTGSPDFDAFFLRYQRPVYTYLRRLLPTEESAIDLTQEAFFRAWRHFERLRGYQRPEAWLFRVATNLALSQLRRREPLHLSRLLWRDTDGQTSNAEDEALLPASADDLPDQSAERDVIARSLGELPARQRAALLLRAAYGFSVGEVAETLGVSVSNTYQLLSRGARRFRDLYDAAQRDSEA